MPHPCFPSGSKAQSGRKSEEGLGEGAQEWDEGGHAGAHLSPTSQRGSVGGIGFHVLGWAQGPATRGSLRVCGIKPKSTLQVSRGDKGDQERVHVCPGIHLYSAQHSRPQLHGWAFPRVKTPASHGLSASLHSGPLPLPLLVFILALVAFGT